MKGHNSSVNSRGRQYAIMLFLAFGAAVLGVMVLNKLRERRIFSILVKEKDHQLISLHLLLQKERDHNKEAKTKMEEMKAKMYSIQTQKMELDGRIMEMQSTISSLKDEQKTLETALEEKQNEIKFLREKDTEPRMENPQVITLVETLKQKESEIEELKHRLENPTRIWSVSTDDPSNSALHSTNNFQRQVQRDKIGNEKSGDKIEVTKTEGFQANETVDETEAKSTKEEAITTNTETENLSLRGNSESRQMEMNSRGGVKLEMQDNSSGRDGNDGMEKESGYANDTNKKRLTLHARQRKRGGVKRNRKVRMDGQQSGKYKRIVDEVLQRRGMHLGEVETGTDIHAKDEHGLDNEPRGNGTLGVDEHEEKRMEVNSTNERVAETQRNESIDVLSNATAADENNNKPGKLELSGENVNGFQVRLKTNDNESTDQINEEEKITKKNEEAEGEQTKEAEEDNTESKTEQEEDKEIDGEETDDPEF